MRAALDWSFAIAGAMNAANALGYLVGALLAARLATRFGARNVFLFGLAGTAITVLLSAATASTPLLLVLRLLSGIAGAATFVLGGALVAKLGEGLTGRRAGLLLGCYFGGSGIGIFCSAVALPPLLGALDPATGWRWGWVVLGVLAGFAALGAIPAVLRSPEPVTERGRGRWPVAKLAPLLLAYTLFGVGYIAYMTFIVAFLRDAGRSTAEVTVFWAVLGLVSIGSGFLWGPPLGAWSGGRGPAIVLSVVTVGAAIPLLSASAAMAIGSAVVFGVAFLVVAAAMTAVAQRIVPAHQLTAAIGGLTTAFALGQCLGPVLAGVLSDSADGVRAGLLLSAVILLIAVPIAAAQRQHTR
ncbi:cyanate permease [Tamaricihabitans halophyticus]|uniref:Cyanate permease n=2 Tax=Tamaricihabitans halophyticus TaxID=1262583 RepID=A0A4V2SUM8_9PSEU|nr:cyanate permease [Tamaricihabitans halophyticus]